MLFRTLILDGSIQERLVFRQVRDRDFHHCAGREVSLFFALAADPFERGSGPHNPLHNGLCPVYWSGFCLQGGFFLDCSGGLWILATGRFNGPWCGIFWCSLCHCFAGFGEGVGEGLDGEHDAFRLSDGGLLAVSRNPESRSAWAAYWVLDSRTNVAR